MTFEFLMVFIVTVFVASVIPGPSMLLALSLGMSVGIKRSIPAALGNVSITFIQAAISIAGLGAILMASETVFTVIKWIGAVYLIYLGIGMIRASNKSFNLEGSTAEFSRKGSFVQSALVTAGNPKAIVFFSAVFPQFIDANTSLSGQALMLLTICCGIAFLCFMLYASMGRQIVQYFSDVSIGQKIRKVIGGTFVGAGIGLAFSNR